MKGVNSTVASLENSVSAETQVADNTQQSATNDHNANSQAVDAASNETQNYQFDSFFLDQLTELSSSIASSFESINTSLDHLKKKANLISAIASTLNGGDPTTNGIISNLPAPTTTTSNNNHQASATTPTREREHDTRLVMSAAYQQAQAHLQNGSNAQKALDLVVSDSQSQHQVDPSKRPSNALTATLALTTVTPESAPPEIDLNPRAKTVADLWKEWQDGYRGQPALKDLESKYGTKWRKGRIAKSAQRRKKVIEFIDSEAKRNNLPHDRVVGSLEKYRNKKKKGLFWLYGGLPPQLFHPDGSEIEINSEDEDKQDDHLVNKQNHYNHHHSSPSKTQDVTAAVVAAAARAEDIVSGEANDDTTDPALKDKK